MRKSGRETLVKLNDVGRVGAYQGFGLIRADTVAYQPDLVRFVDVAPFFGTGYRVYKQASVDDVGLIEALSSFQLRWLKHAQSDVYQHITADHDQVGRVFEVLWKMFMHEGSAAAGTLQLLRRQGVWHLHDFDQSDAIFRW